MAAGGGAFMGRLSPEMKAAIKELYSKHRSYTKVARELGLDSRTVRKHIRDETEMEDGSIHQHSIVHDIMKDAPMANESKGQAVTSSSQVQQLTPEDYKALYGEINRRTSPNKIIEEYGFRPDIVERECIRASRMTDPELIEIQKRILHYYGARKGTPLEDYAERFANKGRLTVEETIRLVDHGTRIAEYDAGRPTWVPLWCTNCGKPYCLINPYDEIGRQIFCNYRGSHHSRRQDGSCQAW